MRPDVKLGIVLSMVFVLVAGTYFLYRGNRDAPIQVATNPARLTDDLTPSKTATGADNARRTARRTPTDAGDRTGVNPTPRRIANRRTATDIAPTKVVRRGDDSANRRPSATRTNSTGSPASGAGKRTSQLENPSTHRADGSEPGADRPGQRPVTHTRRPPPRRVAQGNRRRATSQPTRARRQPAAPLALTARRPGTSDVGSKNTGRASVEAAVERHRVQEGDTMSSLASRYYGDTKLTAWLVKRNPQIADANRLRIGDVVLIPPRPEKAKVTTRPSPRRVAGTSPAGGGEYRVKAGDSFYKIARDVLGDAGRWRELFQLNRDRVDGDPTRLQVDQVILLPKP